MNPKHSRQRPHFVLLRRSGVLALGLLAAAALAQNAPAPARSVAPRATPGATLAAAATPRKEAAGTALHPQPWLAGALLAPMVGPVTLYAPPAGQPVRGLALFASGDGGWNLGVIDMARRAAASGLWVAGFSTPRYFKSLAAQPASQCVNAAGTLQALGSSIKQQLGLPPTLPVILVGYSSGATLVYAALVQAKPDTFQGGLSLGFCPEMETRHPFCPGTGDLTFARSKIPPHWPALAQNTHLQAPWHILQGDIDEVCAPRYAPDFVAGVPGAKAWVLPHVGHGFGYPRNWAAQYQQALNTLLPAMPTAAAAVAHSAAGSNAARPARQSPTAPRTAVWSSGLR